jgi:hypothetical protein
MSFQYQKREGGGKVACAIFFIFLWEKGGLQKRLATLQKIEKNSTTTCHRPTALFLVYF